MQRLFPVLLLLVLAFAAYSFLTDDGDDINGSAFEDDLLGEIGGGPTPDEMTSDGVDDGPGQLRTDDAPPEAGDTPGVKRRKQTMTVRGRVVDEQRRPVAGARVELRLGARKGGSATSEQGGGYEMLVARLAAMRALLVATTEDGRSGTLQVFTPPGSSGVLVVDAIVLKPVSELRVKVVQGGGAPVEGARVVVARRSAGAPVPLATHRTGSNGMLTIGGLPQGAVEVFASARGAGRGHRVIRLPQRTRGEIPEIELPGERVIDVLVVDASDRRPIRGATVLVGDKLSMPQPDGPGYLPPLDGVVTNASGRATVEGVGVKDVLYINARATGYVLAPWWRHQQRGIGPAEREVTIALRKHRTVRFLVDPSGATPAPGTALQVELDAQATRTAGRLGASMDNDMLVVTGLPDSNVRGVVIAPDGAQAVFAAKPVVTQGPMVTFRGSREVTLHVTDSDGIDAAGVAIRLNALERAAEIDPGTTDASGMVVFQGVGADQVSVHRVRSDRPRGGALLARLDLTDKQRVYEVELQATAQIVLSVRVDGEPRLPSTYGILVGGQPIAATESVEDAQAGTIEAPFPDHGHDRPLSVRFIAEGYLPFEKVIERDRRGEYELSVDLKPAASLTVTVKPPADGNFTLTLQVKNSKTGAWAHAQTPNASLPGAGGLPSPSSTSHTYAGLESGLYRAMDARSKIASDPVRVPEGGGEVEVTLDLGQLVWIEGSVTGPPGANLRQARVVVEGRDGEASPWAGTAVRTDGKFRLRGSRTQPIVLTTTHPTLRPAKDGGRVSVRPGSGPIVLRMETGGEARFRIRGMESAHTPGGAFWDGPLRVHLYKGAPTGKPLRVVQPIAESGQFRFGGFDPGTYTIWFAFGNTYAPQTLRKVRLGDGFTDLGTIEPGQGSTLRIRARKGSSGAVRLWATVVRVDQPTYSRHATSLPDTEEIVCPGIGPGSFKVVVRASGGMPGAGPPVFDEEVAFDGKTDKEIVVNVP